MLGLGGASQDAYFDQIMQQLTLINVKLDQLAERMDEISQQMRASAKMSPKYGKPKLGFKRY